MTQARPRLLVVDDDRFVLSALVAGLSRAGFDVVVATNGDEALRMAADAQPVLAIIDGSMDNKGALVLAGTLAREKRVPFLLLSAPRDEEIRRQAASMGAAGFVSKPVDMARLVPAVRAAIERVAERSRVAEGANLLADTLEGGHGLQALIAIGILVERHKVNCDEAVKLLHQRAAAEHQAVDEVALRVIEQAESVARPSM